MSSSKRRKVSEGGGDDDEADDNSVAEDAGFASASKWRSAMDDASNEFICPITQELPVDPVTAMDGRVYERKAIADWIAKGNGKSPMTNQPMSSTLLPAHHVRNSLELMVKSGALVGDKVEAWKKRLEDERAVEKLRARAANGDARAMVRLAHGYQYGSRGLTKSKAEAERWYRRAYEAGNVQAGGKLGRCTLPSPCAFILLTEAAVKGDDMACYRMGDIFRKGRYGVPQDEKMAAKWYRCMAECTPGAHGPLEINPDAKSEALQCLSDWQNRQE